MEYKYKRGQIFGKRLKVPKHILKKVYSCTLSFQEYLEYQLDDKIPTSCIIRNDKEIVERFGVDVCRKLDWELITTSHVNLRRVLMSIDPHTKDVNNALYEIAKDKILPIGYSPKMKEVYKDRLLTSEEVNNEDYNFLIFKFNNGSMGISEIIYNWDLLKNKDLSFCLLNDENNKNNITDSMLKDFMSEFGRLVPLMMKNKNIYEIINNVHSLSPVEKEEYIKEFTDDILHYNIENYRNPIVITDEQYKEIFKHSSLEEFLKNVDPFSVKEFMKELETLPEDYIYNMPIPFSELLKYDVLHFAGTYGIKNIVDFDNECGHFFTNNNCEMLNLMFDMYMHYSGNEHDPMRSIYTKKSDEERPYTKDEFYEAMRRMIIYGPSDSDYVDKAPDYRTMTGEFRVRNAELFISEKAPEELQKLFYTKSITPQLFIEHPEYIEFLNGKDLSSCFKAKHLKVEGSTATYGYENLYKFLSEKGDFETVIDFIKEYSDVLDIVFNRKYFTDYEYNLKVSVDDNLNQISNGLNKSIRKLIIEKGEAYPKHIPNKLIEEYPTMFLDKNAPEELQEAFYNRTLTSEFILSNPDYKEFLKDIDLEVIFKYMSVYSLKDGRKLRNVNLVNCVEQVFGKEDALDVMFLYGPYIERVFDNNRLENFMFEERFTKDDLLDEFDKVILKNIIDGNMKYDENIPSHFKQNNPTLFLDESVPKEIRDKFYNREFTLEDFDNNPELFEIFDNTNIACAFPEHMSWIIPMFSDIDFKTANSNRMKIITAYSKIQDNALQNMFKTYIMNYGEKFDIEKLEYVSDVLTRLSLSNSTEMFTFRNELAAQILNTDNPLESLNKIEDVFIRNNIPTVGKIYSCFEILHPNFEGFDFEGSMVSPVLKKSSIKGKKIIVFSDLIKASFGSNNRSVNSYLKNIEYGSALYESIKKGEKDFSSLDEKEKEELVVFSNHLATLYNNTMKAKLEKETFISSGDVLTDILELSKKLSPDGTLDYNLSDRVIRMFCGFSGIDTLDDAKEYIAKKVKTADKRNRDAAEKDMILEKGDFIKGIGEVRYLRNILQNGSVSKEYLGSSASSDATPLDTDLSMILSEDGTTREKIDSTAAKGYGPIWFVLKNDDRFMTTRTNSENPEVKRDMSKLEVFYTGVLGQGHYGIRTGFASSEINYIVMEKYDPRVGLEIAMNGFYIPIANKEGKIIFTPEDYDKLREKMSGLSYFDENNYTFSKNLVTEQTEYFAEQIEESNYEVRIKREKINKIIKDALEEIGLRIKTSIDGDLTEGYVELIDTGSTGRGTNKPGDGDFDFMMRLDRTILSNPSKLNELKQTLLRKLGRENSRELTGTGDFRLKGVQIDEETTVDIDITFTEKTDKVSYSTDMSLQDRLETIKRVDPEKYKYVVANILLAKQVLKQAEAYKPNRGEIPQGGLGGVGIENWILQNGGSFIDAAKSFVEASEGKSFSEFQTAYQIWDFGDNHLAERRGHYAHDNFVTNNMSEEGYVKMTHALKEYLKNIENEKLQTEEIKR